MAYIMVNTVFKKKKWQVERKKNLEWWIMPTQKATGF